MDLKKIRSLIKEFEKTSITVLEITYEDFYIGFSKNKAKFVTEVEKNNSKLAPNNPNAEEFNGYEVKSPIVGTFYASSSSKSKPFVSVGKRVKVGDTLCIIETLKIVNEITAPVSGIIDSIIVNNGTPVGFDQVLMIIV